MGQITRRLIALAASGIVVGASSCAPRSETMPALGAGEFRVAGTVRKAAVGVNCWRFDARDGAGYELQPGQAPAEVLVPGLQLTLVLRRRPDLMSACMVGELVDVVRIEPTAAGGAPDTSR